MTRPGLRVVGAVAAASFVALSGARARAAEPAPTPSFSELPAGAMSDPPTKKTPWGIGAGEHAKGFVIQRMPGEYTVVAATKTDPGTVPPGGAPVCYSQPVSLGFAMDGEPPTQEWAQPQPMVNLPGAGELGGRNGVTALHSERVVPVDATHATLEWIDAWVDPTTRGSRLIAKGSLPLRVIRELPGGGQILAGRDAERVHVVVMESPTKKQSFGGRDQLIAVTPRGMTGASGCHHVRVGLRAEKGTADTVTIFTNAQLPDLEDAAARAPLGAKTSFATLRVRPVAVAASVTWASRDAEPVVAISAGWRARESTVQALAGPTSGF